MSARPSGISIVRGLCYAYMRLNILHRQRATSSMQLSSGCLSLHWELSLASQGLDCDSAAIRCNHTRPRNQRMQILESNERAAESNADGRALLQHPHSPPHFPKVGNRRRLDRMTSPCVCGVGTSTANRSHMLATTDLRPRPRLARHRCQVI